MGIRRLLTALPALAAIGFPLQGQPPADPALLPAEIFPRAPHSLVLDIALAADRIVAVGERGHILLSDDYGKTWQQTPAPTRATLTCVAFADQLRGFAAGHNGVLLATKDAGHSWHHLRPEHIPSDEVFLDILFPASGEVLVVGAYGAALLSIDNGQTWTTLNVTEDGWHLNRLVHLPDGRVAIAGEAGALFASRDGHGDWDTLSSPYEGSLFGLLPLNARTWLIHGLRGKVFRTTDAGLSWQEIPLPLPSLLADALRLSSGTILLAGQNGHFFVSYNAGRSFELWPQPDLHGAAALAELPDGTVLVAGPDGLTRLRSPSPLR